MNAKDHGLFILITHKSTRSENSITCLKWSRSMTLSKGGGQLRRDLTYFGLRQTRVTLIFAVEYLIPKQNFMQHRNEAILTYIPCTSMRRP